MPSGEHNHPDQHAYLPTEAEIADEAAKLKALAMERTRDRKPTKPKPGLRVRNTTKVMRSRRVNLEG
jgi:hypothetical protein